MRRRSPMVSRLGFAPTTLLFASYRPGHSIRYRAAIPLRVSPLRTVTCAGGLAAASRWTSTAVSTAAAWIMDRPLLQQTTIRIDHGAARVRGLPSCPRFCSVVRRNPRHNAAKLQIRPLLRSEEHTSELQSL